MRAPAALLLPAVAALAQQVPEGAEPNATTATATVLPLGREAFGTLSTLADADWYRLTLVATTDLRLETGPGPGTQLGDTFLVLLDGAGNVLRSNDHGVAAGFYSRLYANALSPGTYYAAVEAGTAAVAGGSYTLDVRGAVALSLAPPPTVNEGPENNDPRTGGTPTTVTLPARCNGVVSTAGNGGDWDFYRFTLSSESFVQVRVAATATHPSTPRLDDPVLYLFDGASPPALVAGPFRATSFATWNAAGDLRLAAGTWQVAIRGWAGSVAGSYWLDIHRSDGARATVHPGGCGGRVATVATTNSGPGAPAVVERPAIGTTWAVRGSNLGAGGFVFHVVGFASTWIDLGPFGAPGCALEVAYVDTPLQLADAAGATTFAVGLPESGSLLGVTLESQLAVFDLSNPLGLTFSNRVSAVLGN
ncbi:MAG: PPC domain-containing protein [Planctomycetota bacterium]